MKTEALYHKNLIKTIKESQELNAIDFDAYSVKILVDFLKTSHRRFVDQSIPKIEQNFLLLTKYFEGNNKLKTIFNLFIKFQINFLEHIQIEERTMFPYAKTLYKASVSNSIQAVLLIHFSKYSVADFAETHNNNERYLTEIIFLLSREEEIKRHPLFHILIKQMCQLDNEIRTHAWIEDNVLVDKVEEIEETIAKYVATQKS
ncbi:MAG: hypothetical protein HRT73_12630 [Flavobacteriales bacterium]|nr:hypothetical protein [Flavobacteriales bacterium]